MAKTSKLESYWKQNNIEDLLKELTQTLARGMPADPAVAIVQHLQKKFPKSFKTLTDNNNTDIQSKTVTNTLQSQPITSPCSSINIKNVTDVDISREVSNQNQNQMPTFGFTFTDLLKDNVNNLQQSPEVNLRNIVFANRLSQQVVRMGKDIQSNRDILEEEFIKPIKLEKHILSTADSLTKSDAEDFEHGQSSVRQLIEYKQHIKKENDRRQHREKLAELARHVYEQEQILHSDLSAKSNEQKELHDHPMLSPIESNKRIDESIFKSRFTKTTVEEEVLDDENIFQHKRHRHRTHRNQLLASHLNMPEARRRYMEGLGLTIRRRNTNSMTTMPVDTCPVCGNVVNNEQNQSKFHSQNDFIVPMAHSLQPQTATSLLNTTIDDWFEEELDRSVPESTSNNIASRKTNSNLFQFVNENNTHDGRHHSPRISLINTGTESNSKRPSTSQISESDISVKKLQENYRRLSSSSSSRRISSPVTKKHQTDLFDIHHHRSPDITTRSSPMRQVQQTTIEIPTSEQQTFGWGVRERTPDDSDEN